MGVLENQTVRREAPNRRLGRRRLEARDQLRSTAEFDRRRPTRGRRAAIDVRPRPRIRSRFARAVTLLPDLGRALAFVALLPIQLLWLSTRPRLLAERLRTAPARLQAHARRLRLSSRDPETPAGRLWETAILSASFLREEVVDMQDGVPTRAEVLRDLQGGTRFVSDRVASLLGLDGGAAEARDQLAHAAGVGLIGASVVVGLFLAGYHAVEALQDSDRLVLDTIEVDGSGRTGEAAVLAALPARAGDHLLRLDLARLAAEVEALPWVAEARVERDLRERRLLVRVVEHRPVLLLAGEGLTLVDDAGVAFKPLEPGDPHDLPLLTRADASSPVDAVVLGALPILRALDQGAVLGTDSVSELRHDPDQGYTVVTRDGLPVLVGHRDFGPRLGRVERALASGRLPLAAVASVDAALRDRLVVHPRRTTTAKKAIKRVVAEQPVQRADRRRLLHLERIRRSLAAGAAAGGLP